MQVKDMLKESQPVVYRILENGFKNKKTSHAYLISGEKGMPVRQTAIFLAQSFLCDSSEHLACEECINCIRVKDETYADLIIIDGEKDSIKKDMIDSLQEEFMKTALEEKGLKVYIIHLVEKATSSAINGLLKFLEEPSSDVVAILTTENATKVLPTIVSRCQLLRLKAISKTGLINELVDTGVGEEDAKVLVNFFNDKDEILNVLEDESYQEIKDLAFETFLNFKNDNDFVYFVQRQVAPKVNKKEQFTLFLGILELLFKDSLLDGLSIFNNDEFKLDYDKEEIEQFVYNIIMCREKIDLNANIALLLDDLCYKLMYREGGK